jgi:hypothetical protein
VERKGREVSGKEVDGSKCMKGRGGTREGEKGEINK